MPESAIPAELLMSVEQFNQKQFYECHDSLEALWMEAPEFEKNFYQGILQVAVAFYHLSNHNWQGAVILLGEGRRRLQRYQPTYAGLDIDGFVVRVAETLLQLQQSGAEKVEVMARQIQPPRLDPISSKNFT